MNGIRASDRDREEVLVRLEAAAGEGRLTLVEFEDRSGQVYVAKTYGELDALVADLPSAHGDKATVLDRRGLALSLLALAGGVVWMPLFPYLDFGALPGAAGVVFGLLGLRANAHLFCRVLALLGLAGGSVGVALQVVWIIFQLVEG
ncbi:DUF1707 domain-containing protein [Micromonospora costi]|uniref:DUF1707 SHOCT-like domain-containing protein n=1 Tax=Micromonospora costi TaxID=1530042 RepID=UPI0033FF5A74